MKKLSVDIERTRGAIFEVAHMKVNTVPHEAVYLAFDSELDPIWDQLSAHFWELLHYAAR